MSATPDSPLGDDSTPTQTQRHSGVGGGTIGPYRLLERLGEGGMGEVWLAEQSEPVRRRVALKVLKAGMDTRRWWRGSRPSGRRSRSWITRMSPRCLTPA